MIKIIIGIILLILSVSLFFNYPIIYNLIDNSENNYIINFNNSSDFNFSFTENFITEYNKTYINIYTEQLKYNNSFVIEYVSINDCFYTIENKSYITSLKLENFCLNEQLQNIKIDSNAIINKIEIEYKGTDYNKNYYYSFFKFLPLLFICMIFIFLLYEIGL